MATPKVTRPHLRTEDPGEADNALAAFVAWQPIDHDATADFEHGQLWITCGACGGQWSVCDATGGDSVDGFSFERVSDGDDDCDERERDADRERERDGQADDGSEDDT